MGFGALDYFAQEAFGFVPIVHSNVDSRQHSKVFGFAADVPDLTMCLQC